MRENRRIKYLCKLEEKNKVSMCLHNRDNTGQTKVKYLCRKSLFKVLFTEHKITFTALSLSQTEGQYPY